MKKEWECRKCSFLHQKEGEFSWLKCKNCPAFRWPWMIWALGGLMAILLAAGVWALFPAEPRAQKPIGEGEVVAQLYESIENAGGENDSKEDDNRENNSRENKVHLTTHDILCLLHQGEFLQVKKCFQSNRTDDAQKGKIVQEMKTFIKIDVTLQYQKEGQKPSPLYPLEAGEMEDLTLTHRDNYRLTITVQDPNVFLYIFQKDAYNQIKRLFPDPVWGGEKNPLHGGKSYQLPPGEREWFYLDELPSKQKEHITETLYLIASPWPAKDIERLYGEIYGAVNREAREKAVGELFRRMRLRDTDTFQALYYREFSFSHGK